MRSEYDLARSVFPGAMLKLVNTRVMRDFRISVVHDRGQESSTGMNSNKSLCRAEFAAVYARTRAVNFNLGRLSS